MCVKAMLVLHHPVRGLRADACQRHVSITLHRPVRDYVKMCVRDMLVLHHPVRGLCEDVCHRNVSITSPFAVIMFRCVSRPR